MKRSRMLYKDNQTIITHVKNFIGSQSLKRFVSLLLIRNNDVISENCMVFTDNNVTINRLDIKGHKTQME